MNRTYYTYRIRVANQDRVQVEKWDLEQRSLGEPSGILSYQALRAKLQPLLEAAHRNDLDDAEQVKSLGACLFNILFDAGLRQDFVSFYYQVVRQAQQLLRIELDIDEQEMPEVAALPWEFMCLPESANLGTIWIATAPALVFSRRRSQWVAAQPIQLIPGEKLRIALVISAPPELPPVVSEPVQTALQKLASYPSIAVELLPIMNGANPEIVDAVLAQRPHIFHFIGHGRLNDENHQPVGELALTDPALECANWVNADYFSEFFNRHRPGVIILQACEGGSLSASQAFVGVASHIVQQNIPVVVAMQYEVSNMTASRFAQCFYQRLAAGDPVDIAAQEGRRAIAQGTPQYQKRDFATPVIFMRVQDGYLFQQSPRKQSSYSFLKALGTIQDLVTQDREVYHIVLTFREDFQSACNKLNLLSEYKKLHDALHRVELDCYNLIQQEILKWPTSNGLENSSSDSPEFEESLSNLMLYGDKLRMIIKESQTVIQQTRLPASDVEWVTMLATSREAFDQLLEPPEPLPLTILIRQLNGVMQKIDRILIRYPDRINTRLQEAVSELNLPALATTLKSLEERIKAAGVETEKLRPFRDGILALESSQRDLVTQIQEHTAWQNVEIELRRIADDSYRLKDYAGLAQNWELLKPEMEPLYTTCDSETCALFQQKRDALDQAIAVANPSSIRQHFISYRSFAAGRFFKVDTDLKDLCGKLHQRIADPLASLLEVLDECTT